MPFCVPGAHISAAQKSLGCSAKNVFALCGIYAKGCEKTTANPSTELTYKSKPCSPLQKGHPHSMIGSLCKPERKEHSLEEGIVFVLCAHTVLPFQEQKFIF